jgi:hypothetical protein
MEALNIDTSSIGVEPQLPSNASEPAKLLQLERQLDADREKLQAELVEAGKAHSASALDAALKSGEIDYSASKRTAELELKLQRNADLITACRSRRPAAILADRARRADELDRQATALGRRAAVASFGRGDSRAAI